MNTEITNESGEKVRALTKAETKQLDKYDLSKTIKKFVSNIWSSKPNSVVKEKSSRLGMVMILFNIIMVLLLVALLLEFFDPTGLSIQSYVGGNAAKYVLAVQMLELFLLGVIIAVGFLLALLQFTMYTYLKNMNKSKETAEEKKKREDGVWIPLLLNHFIKKSEIKKTFFLVVKIGTIIALVLNDYYFVSILYLAVMLLLLASNNSMKKLVKKAAKEQIGETIE